jgi:hypothetical protein
LTERDIQAIEDEVVNEDMHMYRKVLRCPHPVLIIDLITSSYEFMAPGSYVPRDHTAYDDIIYNLLPNTTIDYISSEHGRDVVYHLELNSNKIDKYNRPVKKYQIRIES